MGVRFRHVWLHFSSWSIGILDLECVLDHVTGVQISNKNALINPPSWICLRSGNLNVPRFALINRPFWIVNESSICLLRKYRSTHSMSNISMSWSQPSMYIVQWLHDDSVDKGVWDCVRMLLPSHSMMNRNNDILPELLHAPGPFADPECKADEMEAKKMDRTICIG